MPEVAEEAGPNIPSVGSSLFDKIYSRIDEQGKSVYRVPFPLTKLFKPLNSGGGKSVHTMLPFSRSLQRPQDLSFDPILNPRLVFSAKGDETGLTRGKIFFGYVKAKDQLEVISYNDEAGRFEFQIISSYSNNPRVFYVDRGKCLSCHQGQAPIFSAPSWKDTTLGIMGELVDAKLGLNEGSQRERRRLATEALFGPIASREEVAVFDSLVRNSNDISFDERVWVHGCDEDRKCRLGLLLQALSPQASPTSDYFKYASEVTNQSELKKQVFFGSFLSSSDIGVGQAIFKYGSIETVIESRAALLEIISNLYKLTSKDNPATRREIPLLRRDLGLRQLKSFSPMDLKRLRQEIPNVEKIADILIQLYEEKSPIFAKNALNKLEVMSVVLAKARSSEAESYRSWLLKKTPKKELFKGKVIPIFEKAELNIFSRYCHKCHASGLRFPPQFLIGSEADVVSKITTLKSRIAYKLKRRMMPPNRRQRQTLESSGDLDRLLTYLQSL